MTLYCLCQRRPHNNVYICVAIALWFRLRLVTASQSRLHLRHAGSGPGSASSRTTRLGVNKPARGKSESCQTHPNTRQILCPSAPNQHHAVFLQVVPLSGNIRNSRLARRELHSADLSDGRVGLLRLGRVDFGDDRFLLETVGKERRVGVCGEAFATPSEHWSGQKKRLPRVTTLPFAPRSP